MSNITVKLVNYATTENSKLKLFTELNHTFVVGDVVYISGGYYDNTTITNPFILNTNTNSYKQGYTVIGVDYINHSITLDYEVGTLVYPYGTLLNKFGNPQDAVNLAYNTFTGDNLYNDIYISTNVFNTGNVFNATINNGIFGTDTNQILMRDYTMNTAAITVNHIASKNTRIHNATINDKAHSNDLSTLCRLVEDATIGSIDNPYEVEYISIAANNNTYGFSKYERLYIHNVDAPTIINNGEFSNPKSGNIFIHHDVNNGKFGSKEPMYGCEITSTITTGELNNIKSNSSIQINGGTVDTFIEFHNVTALSLVGNVIRFKVDYNDIANKKWDNGKTIYITGIKTIATNTFDSINSNVLGTIVDTDYTVGDINSAYIELDFTGGFSEALVDCDFSLLRIHIINDTLTDLNISDSTITTYMSPVTPMSISGASVIKYGSYDNIKFDKTTNLDGISYQLPITLGNSNIQYGDDSITTNTIQHTLINSKWSAVISNSHINSGIIYDSIISDTTTNSDPLVTTYLHNVELSDGAKIESNVFWDYAKITWTTADTVVLPNIVNNAYLGERKTPWVTGSIIEALPITSFAKNINKIRGTRATNWYNSQTLIDNNNKLFIEVPNVLNYQPYGLDGGAQFVLIDHGPMSSTQSPPFTWFVSIPYINDRIIFSDILNNNIPLNTNIFNKVSNTTSGTYNTFPATFLAAVDDNFVYELPNYNYPTEARTARDVSIDIKTTYNSETPYPNNVSNQPLSQCFLKLIPSRGLTIDDLYNTNSVNVPDGICELNFRLNPLFTQYITSGDVNKFPNCLIEVERVIIIKSTAAVIDSIDIKDCNYIPDYNSLGTDRYATDANTSSITDNTTIFPTDFVIRDNLDNIVNVDLQIGSEYDIQVEFWFTWYDRTTIGLTDPNNGNVSINRQWGKRTKHTINLNIVATNETFNITTDNGPTEPLITGGGDNLIWL